MSISNDLSNRLNIALASNAAGGELAAILNGTITIGPTYSDGVNLAFGTTTGSQIGTGATQKLAFYGTTPIVQPANTVDYVTMLTNLGLRATGGTAAATFPGNVVAGLKATAQLFGYPTPPTDTYGAAIAIDVTKGFHVIAGVNGTSATAALTPSGAGTVGDELIIVTSADSGGTVTVTFASTFHSSGTQATTASHFSSITFVSDGTRWVEKCRTTNLA